MRRYMGINAALAGGLISAASFALPTAAMAQVNGLMGTESQSGAGATLATTNTYNGVTGGATVSDTAPTGTGTDRYALWLSENGGATAFTVQPGYSWSISADVTLTGGTITPRKEAGIDIGIPSNDGEFILDTDAGEIVAFGGNAPFALFGNNSNATNNTNGNGNPFVNGQTIFMGEVYNAGAQTLTYYAQNLSENSPLFTSGPNLAYVPPSPFTLGFYTQWSPSGPSDSDNVVFSNVQASITVPEPATISMLAIGTVALLARRRAKSPI